MYCVPVLAVEHLCACVHMFLFVLHIAGYYISLLQTQTVTFHGHLSIVTLHGLQSSFEIFKM